jgi:hypothetical protein
MKQESKIGERIGSNRPTRQARLVIVGVAAVALLASGCSRDTRVNSDPGPGKPSQADGGDKAVRPNPNQAAPSSSGASAGTGTDSTGRPSDASGGTTGAGAGSGTSGTATPKNAGETRK